MDCPVEQDTTCEQVNYPEQDFISKVDATLKNLVKFKTTDCKEIGHLKAIMTTKSHAQYVVIIIHQKASEDPSLASYLANVCKQFTDIHVPDENGLQINFLEILERTCRRSLNLHLTDDFMQIEELKLIESAAPEEKNKCKEVFLKKRREIEARLYGNINFLCCLYEKKMVPEDIMLHHIKELILEVKFGNNKESLDYLLSMLKYVEEDLFNDPVTKRSMLKSLIKDVIRLRKKIWTEDYEYKEERKSENQESNREESQIAGEHLHKDRRITSILNLIDLMHYHTKTAVTYTKMLKDKFHKFEMEVCTKDDKITQLKKKLKERKMKYKALKKCISKCRYALNEVLESASDTASDEE